MCLCLCVGMFACMHALLIFSLENLFCGHITIISSYEANSSVWSMSVSKTVNVKTVETMAGSCMMPGVTVNASEEEKKIHN